MNIIIVFIAVIAAFVILWIVLSKKKDTDTVVAYECRQCGELHCDCYRKDKTKPPGKAKYLIYPVILSKYICSY
jgi:hypothetical protein